MTCYKCKLSCDDYYVIWYHNVYCRNCYIGERGDEFGKVPPNMEFDRNPKTVAINAYSPIKGKLWLAKHTSKRIRGN